MKIGEGTGGVAIIVNNKWKKFVIKEYRNDEAAGNILEIAILINKTLLNVAVVYIPTGNAIKRREDVVKNCSQLMEKYKNMNALAIIGGDWNSVRSDSVKFINYGSDMGFHYCSVKESTHINGTGLAIDGFFVSANLVQKCSNINRIDTQQGLSASVLDVIGKLDHYMVGMDVRIMPTIKVKSEMTDVKWIIPKSGDEKKWETFYEEVSRILAENPVLDCEELNKAFIMAAKVAFVANINESVNRRFTEKIMLPRTLFARGRRGEDIKEELKTWLERIFNKKVNRVQDIMLNSRRKSYRLCFKNSYLQVPI